MSLDIPEGTGPVRIVAMLIRLVVRFDPDHYRVRERASGLAFRARGRARARARLTLRVAAVPTSIALLPPIVYEGRTLASVRIYRGRCRHVWVVVRRERRLDEHVCLQVGRVGISPDNVGKRGF